MPLTIQELKELEDPNSRIAGRISNRIFEYLCDRRSSGDTLMDLVQAEPRTTFNDIFKIVSKGLED